MKPLTTCRMSPFTFQKAPKNNKLPFSIEICAIRHDTVMYNLYLIKKYTFTKKCKLFFAPKIMIICKVYLFTNFGNMKEHLKRSVYQHSTACFIISEHTNKCYTTIYVLLIFAKQAMFHVWKIRCIKWCHLCILNCNAIHKYMYVVFCFSKAESVGINR